MKEPAKLFVVTGALLSAAACGISVEPPAARVRVGRSNHSDIFPISSGAHNNADCNACHGAFTTFTEFSCIMACHEHSTTETVPRHSGIGGFVYDDTSCYGCHPDGEGTSREAHQLNFPILGVPHGTIDCAECHPNGYGTFACINCHEHLCAEMNSKHREVGGYQCVSTSCKNCHPDGRVRG